MIAHGFDEVLIPVRDLVADSRRNEARFRSPKYSEYDVRQHFINKFWQALGWDVLMFTDFKSSFPQVTIFSLSQIPIRTTDRDAPAERKKHDDVPRLVGQMLAAKRQLAGARTEAERSVFERKCAAIDRQLDGLLYKLYGLTGGEIALVEAG
jgi:hypothetical protein